MLLPRIVINLSPLIFGHKLKLSASFLFDLSEFTLSHICNNPLKAHGIDDSLRHNRFMTSLPFSAASVIFGLVRARFLFLHERINCTMYESRESSQNRFRRYWPGMMLSQSTSISDAVDTSLFSPDNSVRFRFSSIHIV